MNDRSDSHAQGAEAREAIAKVIDPHSFLPYTDEDEIVGEIVRQSKEDALRKADKILALRSPAGCEPVTETDVILDAINDRSPRVREAMDRMLYKFDVRPK